MGVYVGLYMYIVCVLMFVYWWCYVIVCVRHNVWWVCVIQSEWWCVCIIHRSMCVVFMILRVSFRMSVLLCVVSFKGSESFIV